MRCAAAGAVALLAAVAVVLAVSPGGAGERPAGSGGLVWERPPLLVVPQALPNDRILTGQVRNDSLRVIAIRARDVRVIDGQGARVRAAAIFLSSYAHRLPPFNRPDVVPTREQRLKGIVARIEPGRRVPLTVSWHVPKRSQPPVRVELANASLPIPGRR